MYKIPILFIIFNRPQIANQAFEVIKTVKPKYLYIASDAARDNKAGEDALVQQTRDMILHNIDWDCNVNTLFHSKNQGCGMGVYTAISWFFNHVNMGIILEDDCIVDRTFFFYMEELLIRYQNDDRIGMVAGTNPIVLDHYQYSYLFSKYKSCWGWGTWKRAWNNMDIDMVWRNSDISPSVLNNSGYRGKDISNWKSKLRYIDNNYVSAWDWQWYFSLSAQNQLCIYPSVNLVSNIGSDKNATHTSLSNITIKSGFILFPLKHPLYIVSNVEFDKLFYKNTNTLCLKIQRMIPYNIKQKIKRILLKLQNNA